MTSEVLVDVEEHVATLRLNRPHRRNAISITMLRELTDALARADRDPGVRVIVLTGEGAGFCAGLDIKDAMAGTGIGGGGRVSPDGGATTQGATRDIPTVVLHEIDTPVIAAINGAAVGYGVDLALGCDLRLGSHSTRIIPGFAKRGVVPESGGTWYLPRLVGWARAAEIGFLGRELSAARAHDLGLLNLVTDDDRLLATAHEWAIEIAANAPLAVRAMKKLFRMSLSESFAAHTDHVLLQLAELMGTDDFREGLTAFVERRDPRFQGR
jgi:enoyl-CoA hydratase/carnithine racemase